MLILSILLVLFSLVFFFIINSHKKNQSDFYLETGKGLFLLPAGLFIAGLAFSVIACYKIIPAGHGGVQTLFGNVIEQDLEEGFNWVNPLSDIIVISQRVEKNEKTYPAETIDTQSVQITFITNWKPRKGQLWKLYKTYGEHYSEKIIPLAVREGVKAEVAKYKVTELIQNRPRIHDNLHTFVNDWLEKYDIIMLETAVAEIDFSEKYDEAIETKQVQEQLALQKQYELQKVETEAKMAKAVAEGEANSRIEQARGEAQSKISLAKAEAESLKIRGEAQAEFNRRVAESLNPLLLQNHYLERWDGKLPTYMLGESTTPLLMMPTK